MGLSRTARISLLLAIDICFFFVELIAGYAVGSLALVADSFHMLNDVVSLVIALYAIKLTANATPDTRYSYGWHRAEILAALVNGVFLLALCFSITLDALERFFSTPEISNPKLVVIVGSLGLASNIVGLFLFHEHGHSHGHSHDQSASSSKTPSIATLAEENGHIHDSPTDTRPPITPSRSRPSDVPRRRERSDSYSSLYGHPAATRASLVQRAEDLVRANSPAPAHRRARSSMSRPRPSFDNSQNGDTNTNYNDEEDERHRHSRPQSPDERTPLIRPSSVLPPAGTSQENGHGHDHEDHGNAHSHGGHSHGGSMNMKALLLHVLGDALGNVGVIATGLIIWLTSWSFKYYCDPMISLVITVIIFQSALPLVRSTSFILLQGVPPDVSFEDVRSAILRVEGVLGVHELHIWQLSESKVIASVHVMASRNHDFMPVASEIRRTLHMHRIHSSTIQPEYHPHDTSIPDEFLKTASDTACLISCPPDAECDSENACCPPISGTVTPGEP